MIGDGGRGVFELMAGQDADNPLVGADHTLIAQLIVIADAIAAVFFGVVQSLVGMTEDHHRCFYTYAGKTDADGNLPNLRKIIAGDVGTEAPPR